MHLQTVLYLSSLGSALPTSILVTFRSLFIGGNLVKPMTTEPPTLDASDLTDVPVSVLTATPKDRKQATKHRRCIVNAWVCVSFLAGLGFGLVTNHGGTEFHCVRAVLRYMLCRRPTVSIGFGIYQFFAHLPISSSRLSLERVF